MPSHPRLAIVTSDSKLILRCKELLEPTFQIQPHNVDLAARSTSLKATLREIVDELVGLADGHIDTQCVIFDATFTSRPAKEVVAIDDPLYDDLPSPANTIVSTIMGAGIPLIVNPNVKDIRKAWALGNSGAIFLEAATLKRDAEAALASLPYNVETLQVENEFALGYDRDELAGAATVSAVLWENEYVLNHVREHVRGASDPVHVLDLGCGTGRFEELLLTDSEVKNKIATITAVDFAPMYFQMARRRLPHFLEKSDLEKIRYVRRIAEDLRWPSDHFDVVIASFGILCFSQTHRTLPNIYRVLKQRGLAILNGYNREAMTFDFDEMMRKRIGRSASHFAIRIDREENIMHLGNQIIRCFTFYVDDVEGLLSLTGFRPVKNDAETFPALYGSARKEYLTRLMTQEASSASGVGQHHESCRRTGKCRDFASYQRINLVKDQFGSGFNETLHQMDTDLASLLPRKGFYFCVAAHK